jgi:hypothetical protein
MPFIPLNSARAKRGSPSRWFVEEVEVPARQARDLGERGVHALRVERSAAAEERVLVAEVAVLRTPAADHDRVRDEVAVAPDQISADRRYVFDRAARRRSIEPLRTSGAELDEELRKRLLARAQEDRVGMRRGFLRERRDVQSPERDEDASRAIVIGDPVRTVRVGDVHLNDDEVRSVVDGQRFDVLVDDRRLVIGPQVRRERREPQRREERVLDRPPVGARGFRQGGEDELHAERLDAGHTLHCKVYAM